MLWLYVVIVIVINRMCMYMCVCVCECTHACVSTCVYNVSMIGQFVSGRQLYILSGFICRLNNEGDCGKDMCNRVQ